MCLILSLMVTPGVEQSTKTADPEQQGVKEHKNLLQSNFISSIVNECFHNTVKLWWWCTLHLDAAVSAIPLELFWLHYKHGAWG